nr:hypothetical protein [uncultured Dyadobacter sp.]
MKIRTRNYLTIVWALFFSSAISGCVESVDTDPKNLIGRWQMVKVVHQGKAIVKPDQPDYYNEVEMEFLENGTVEGTLPLDVFSGSYKVSGEDSITIEGRQLSKIGIPEWGDYFYENMRIITTFSLKKRGLNLKYNELNLNYSGGKLIFERVK